MAIKALFLALFLTVAVGQVAHAAIDPDQAARALVGEAGGQSDAELYAHACALKNRGTLRGVYGLNAPHLAREPKWSFTRAAGMWEKAHKGVDVVGGRTEWRSEYDLKLMAKKGRTVKGDGLLNGLKVGDTWFYHLKGGRK